MFYADRADLMQYYIATNNPWMALILISAFRVYISLFGFSADKPHLLKLGRIYAYEISFLHYGGIRFRTKPPFWCMNPLLIRRLTVSYSRNYKNTWQKCETVAERWQVKPCVWVGKVNKWWSKSNVDCRRIS